MPDAGWYEDPQEPQRLRWWDGQRWGAHAPQQTAAAPVPAQPQYPWMQAQPVPQQTHPADRPMTPTPTWGFSVPPIASQPYPQPYSQQYPQQLGQEPYPQQPTGRVGSAARERAIRAVNPVAYAAMLVTILTILINPFGTGPIAGLVLGVIGIVRARQLVGLRFTGLAMSVAAVVISAVRLVLFAWQLVRLLH